MSFIWLLKITMRTAYEDTTTICYVVPRTDFLLQLSDQTPYLLFNPLTFLPNPVIAYPVQPDPCQGITWKCRNYVLGPVGPTWYNNCVLNDIPSYVVHFDEQMYALVDDPDDPCAYSIDYTAPSGNSIRFCMGGQTRSSTDATNTIHAMWAQQMGPLKDVYAR